MTASSDSTAPRGQRPEKSAAAEKDVFDGPQAVELQVYAKPGSGSCLAYFRACSYPATRHYRPRRFFFHRKSAATWGLIPAKNPAAVANASVISASKAHTVVLLADRVSPCRHTL